MNFFLDILNFFTKKQKIFFFIIAILILFAALLETLSIALIIPVVYFVNNPSLESQSNYEIVNYIISLNSDFLKLESNKLFLLLLTVIVIVYFLKCIYLTFTSYINNRFIYSLQKNLSLRLFKKYIYSNSFFRNEVKSSNIIKNVVNSSETIVSSVVIPMIIIFTELGVAIALSAMLLFLNPNAAILTILVLSLFCFLFYNFFKKKISIWGSETDNFRMSNIKLIQESFRGIKLIKIYNKEDFLIKEFQEINNKLYTIYAKFKTLNDFPRFGLELLSIIGFSILIITSAHNLSSDLIPTIAFFAASAFRILPSTNRLLSSIQQLKYGKHFFYNIKSEFQRLHDSELYFSGKNKHIQHSIFFKELSVNKLEFSYKGPNRLIFNKVNFKIIRGESIGIIGASGAGKTTLIDLLLGFLTPQSGQIKYNNISIFEDIKNWRSLIGFVPQETIIFDEDFRQNITLEKNSSNINFDILNKVIIESKLNFIYDLPNSLLTNVGELGSKISGGQAQRIGIARALYRKPQILILDEATSALDKNTEDHILDMINSNYKDVTKIIISHRESTLKYCTKNIIIKNGLVIEEKN
jgi:ABC-type multidrug transport system fused ATPase/permease subunit